MRDTNTITDKSSKQNRQPYQRVFIVKESYAGKRTLSDIFAELLYSAYRKNESGDTGKGVKARYLRP
jgi:hypothetical protein